MKKMVKTKYIHIGQYVAAVDVELLETDVGWSPYISLESARKMDEIRKALKNNDFTKAGQMANIYKMSPLFPPHSKGKEEV